MYNYIYKKVHLRIFTVYFTYIFIAMIILAVRSTPIANRGAAR